MENATLQNGSYHFVWSITTTRSVAPNSVAWAANARGLLGIPGVSVGAVTSECPTVGITYMHTLTAVVTLSRPTTVKAITRAAVDAYKTGVDRGISAPFVTDQFFDNGIHLLSTNGFPLTSPYRLVSGEFHSCSPTASADMEYSTTLALISRDIADSSVASHVGQPTPSVPVLKNITGAIEQATEIPVKYQIAAAAVLGIIGIGVVGYTWRAFR